MKAFALPIVALVSIVVGSIGASSQSDGCNGPNARTKPPAGAIVVDATGSHSGSFRTVKDGIANLVTSSEEEQTIFIFPGTYQEQVSIPALKGSLVLQGSTCNSKSYASNKVTITHSKAQKDLPSGSSTDLTSAVRLKSNNVKVYNLNIANTARNEEQAVAATVDGTNIGFYGCNLTGYQDTLYTRSGRQLYARSYISGAIDFIFGLQAMAWFERCDIETIDRGYITANGRASEDDPSFYVFNKARVFGSNEKGSSYLGRPWRPFARVVFQKSDLGDVINPAGWTTWGDDPNTNNVVFGEFGNHGAGAATDKRVQFSTTLQRAVQITDILGESYKTEGWVDTRYL